MSRDELNTNLEQARGAEQAANFLSAAHYYKEALKIARNLSDSASITLCKNKIVEMNQKAQKDFKRLSVRTELSKEQLEEIQKIVNSILDGDLETILQKIGVNPYLFPHIQRVEQSAQKTSPVILQMVSLSIIDSDGHLIRGGNNSNYAWIMKTYGIQQGMISELYLKRIFDGLIEKGFNENSLMSYLRSKDIFPENNLAVIATGVNRYFAGDYVSALHILIPQFENVFLLLSERLGIDIIALNRGKEISTQLKTLSVEYLSSEPFQNKWGRDFCEQIKFVLFEPLGYMLRHKVSHGQITVAECTPQMANLIMYFFLVLAAIVTKKHEDSVIS